MRAQNSLFTCTLAAVCVCNAARPVAADDPASSPPPALGVDAFTERLEEDFYKDAPKEVEAISVSNRSEKEFILDNLAHLPKLAEIEFSKVEYSKSDFQRIAAFANIKRICFDEYSGVDPTILNESRSVDSIKFSRCAEVPWASLKEIRGPKIRCVEISDTYIDGQGLRAVAEIATLEAIEFAQPESLDDTDLRELARAKGLKSLTVYNCRATGGSFLAHLDGLQELREFKYTGSLPSENAHRLAAFPKLEAIEINADDDRLPAAWYAEIAKNCKRLKHLRLWYQALDKAKIEHLTSLSELEHLAVYSDTRIADTRFGGPPVFAEPGDLEALGRLKKLQSLHLSRGYSLNAADGAAICSLANLRRLELWYADLEPGSLARLGQLTELNELNLYRCGRLGTEDAKGIGGLKQLEKLDLSRVTKVKDADFSHLKGLENLRELDVSSFSSLTDADMAMAQGMTRLEELTMSGNSRVTDAGFAQLKHATKLRQLWMQHMRIRGTGFEPWPADHALESVFIEGTVISNAGAKALSRFQNLQGLEVRVLKLVGNDVELDVSCFIDTPKLEYVSFLGSYVTTQEAFDKLTKARPELGASCRIKK